MLLVILVLILVANHRRCRCLACWSPAALLRTLGRRRLGLFVIFVIIIGHLALLSTLLAAFGRRDGQGWSYTALVFVRAETVRTAAPTNTTAAARVEPPDLLLQRVPGGLRRRSPFEPGLLGEELVIDL